MAIATGRTVLTGLILSLGVLFRPGTAESCSPVEHDPGRRQPVTRDRVLSFFHRAPPHC
jgi:hypothetical protein